MDSLSTDISLRNSIISKQIPKTDISIDQSVKNEDSGHKNAMVNIQESITYSSKDTVASVQAGENSGGVFNRIF